MISFSPATLGTGSSAGSRWFGTALAALASVAVGIVLGLLLTMAALRSDAIGTIRVGPWRVSSDVGTGAINPYARARLARTGAVPLAAAQGLTATAREDDAGHMLDGRCRYRVKGPAPASQFWTLEAADPFGQPFANAAERQGFTATNTLRDSDGRFTVMLSPVVEAGNWLPLSGSPRFLLVLRLYDTGLLNGGAAGVREAAWPTIEALGCD